MAINFDIGATSTFEHYINYKAGAGTWEMSTDDRNVPFNFTKVVFDLNTMEMGWQLWPKGGSPIWQMDTSAEEALPKPDADWKRGFKVRVFSKALFGDYPVRLFSCANKGGMDGMKKLWMAYDKAKQPGKLPVVAFNGSTKINVGEGSTCVPDLVIDKWIDAPQELLDAVLGVEEVAASPSSVATSLPDGAGDSDEDDEF